MHFAKIQFWSKHYSKKIIKINRALNQNKIRFKIFVLTFVAKFNFFKVNLTFKKSLIKSDLVDKASGAPPTTIAKLSFFSAYLSYFLYMTNVSQKRVSMKWKKKSTI